MDSENYSDTVYMEVALDKFVLINTVINMCTKGSGNVLH